MMPAELRWRRGPFVIKPVIPPLPYRQELIQSMARALREAGTANCEQDAVRSLFGNGYSMFDIANLLPEARALVFQDVVAEEMSKP